MPTGVLEGLKRRRQRAGREGDVVVVVVALDAAVLDVVEEEGEGAKAIVFSRVETVAWTASDSRS